MGETAPAAPETAAPEGRRGGFSPNLLAAVGGSGSIAAALLYGGVELANRLDKLEARLGERLEKIERRLEERLSRHDERLAALEAAVAVLRERTEKRQ